MALVFHWVGTMEVVSDKLNRCALGAPLGFFLGWVDMGKATNLCENGKVVLKINEDDKLMMMMIMTMFTLKSEPDKLTRSNGRHDCWLRGYARVWKEPLQSHHAPGMSCVVHHWLTTSCRHLISDLSSWASCRGREERASNPGWRAASDYPEDSELPSSCTSEEIGGNSSYYESNMGENLIRVVAIVNLASHCYNQISKTENSKNFQFNTTNGRYCVPQRLLIYYLKNLSNKGFTEGRIHTTQPFRLYRQLTWLLPT